MKNKNIDIIKLQNLLLNAITEKYANDSVKPGLVLSAISEDKFYASLCRYACGSKQVVASASAETLEGALIELTNKWPETKPTNHVDELKMYLSEFR